MSGTGSTLRFACRWQSCGASVTVARSHTSALHIEIRPVERGARHDCCQPARIPLDPSGRPRLTPAFWRSSPGGLRHTEFSRARVDVRSPGAGWRLGGGRIRRATPIVDARRTRDLPRAGALHRAAARARLPRHRRVVRAVGPRCRRSRAHRRGVLVPALNALRIEKSAPLRATARSPPRDSVSA